MTCRVIAQDTLTSVINAAKAVTDRLDFLKRSHLCLQSDSKSNPRASQLHRITQKRLGFLASSLSYNSDRDLSAVLDAHLKGSQDAPNWHLHCNSTLTAKLAFDLMAVCRVH